MFLQPDCANMECGPILKGLWTRGTHVAFQLLFRTSFLSEVALRKETMLSTMCHVSSKLPQSVANLETFVGVACCGKRNYFSSSPSWSAQQCTLQVPVPVARPPLTQLGACTVAAVYTAALCWCSIAVGRPVRKLSWERLWSPDSSCGKSVQRSTAASLSSCGCSGLPRNINC